jgi:TetR/AcrR family tetracycline transcriptional repressor
VQLIYGFTIGFCIEEQAVAQAGDDRYSLSRRAERVNAAAHPLAAEVGPVIFGRTRGSPAWSRSS